MRRLLSAISLSSTLLLAAFAHADTVTGSNVVFGVPPAGVTESGITYGSTSFSSATSFTPFSVVINDNGFSGSGSQSLSFTMTINGAFGTETVNESGTLGLVGYGVLANISGFTQTSQTVTGVNAYNISYNQYFNGPSNSSLSFNATPNVLAAATPEPGSLVLLGTGVLAMAGAAKRKLMA